MKRFTYVCADPGVPLPGMKGASVHVASLCKAFQQHDLVGQIHTVRAEASSIHGFPLIPIDLPPRRKHKSVEDRENRLVLARLEHDGETPDFIYERYSLWHPGGLYLARKLQIPFILEVNSPLPLETKKFRQLANEPLAEGLTRLLLREADGVVCVSEEIAQWVVSERKHDYGVAVIPNGVDEDLFDPDKAKRPEELPGEKTPLIGFTSTFRPWHGTEDLLESFRILIKEHKSPAHLLCIGDGPERSRFMQIAADLELQDRIHCPGNLPHEQVNHWLSSCSIAVAPYPELDEFWFSPIKIFEYFCCGLPVVGSNVGQVRDLISTDRGDLVAVGDHRAMASSMEKLLSTPEASRKLGENARSWVLKNATWKIRASQVLDLLKEIR
ncbi:MAG: glycosyltransferase family 4 protein [Planctomycetota bacterium]